MVGVFQLSTVGYTLKGFSEADVTVGRITFFSCLKLMILVLFGLYEHMFGLDETYVAKSG